MTATYTTEVVHVETRDDDEVEFRATVEYAVSRVVGASLDGPAYGGEVEILSVTVVGAIPDGWTRDEAEDLVEAGISLADLIADAADTDAYEAECAADYRCEQMREGR